MILVEVVKEDNITRCGTVGGEEVIIIEKVRV
jgi:hypothetical protein